MSCGYDMNELGLPFDQARLTGASGTSRECYFLRVCKDCRADWMRTIQSWFLKGQEAATRGNISIPVMSLGTIRQMTEEEVTAKVNSLMKG